MRRRILLALVVAAVTTAIASSTLGAQRGGGAAPPRGSTPAPVRSVGTAAIVGTVVINEPNGKPLRRVLISLSGQLAGGGREQRQTTTDDQGRFAFLNLPAGTYFAPYAAKGGYVASNYGEKRPGSIGTPITLVDGERLTIAFKLFRGGVITGTLTDNGRPIAATSVSATAVRVVNGVRTASGGRSGTAQTDERGMFRMYGLAPGDYIVAASPRLAAAGETRPITDAEVRWAERQLQGDAVGGTAVASQTAPPPAQPVTYSTVYYPGTTQATSAAIVSVSAGQERAGVDFSVSYVPTAKIEGVILDPDGQPALSAQMNLVPMLDPAETLAGDTFFILDTMMLSRPAVVGGRFTMAGVKPGRYTLTARAAPVAAQPGVGRPGAPPPMTQWATAEITMNGVDQTGLELRLQPGMTVSGRIAFDALTLQPPADLSRMTVRMTQAATGGVTVSVNPPTSVPTPDGTFRIEGVAPGRYHISSFVPGGPSIAGAPAWTLKSVQVGSVDAADVPFEVRPGQAVPEIVVTFTDHAAELTGTVLDAAGKPTPALSIILFSTDRSTWRTGSRRFRFPVRADTAGKFRFSGLMPGEYFLAALGDYEQSEVQKPEFLEQVAAAALKISIAEGEKKVQDLKMSGGG